MITSSFSSTSASIELARLCFAPVDTVDRPGPGERMIIDRNLSAQETGVGPVEADPLVDGSRIVFMQRHPTAFERSRAFEAARFDFQDVIAAVAVVVSPFSDRVTIVAGQ